MAEAARDRAVGTHGDPRQGEVEMFGSQALAQFWPVKLNEFDSPARVARERPGDINREARGLEVPIRLPGEIQAKGRVVAAGPNAKWLGGY